MCKLQCVEICTLLKKIMVGLFFLVGHFLGENRQNPFCLMSI